MFKRTIKFGFKALIVIDDAWLGNRGNIKATIDARLIGVFRMKDENLKYRLAGCVFNLKALFHLARYYRKQDKQPKKCPWIVTIDII